MRTLFLSPSTALASPRAWPAVTANPPPTVRDNRYDEVHCVGGGALLLWLLVRAGRGPRASRVYLHGPAVAPTPDSCAEWLTRAGMPAGASAPDVYEWRQQAVSLGVGGQLRSAELQWLEPMMSSIALGRVEQCARRPPRASHAHHTLFSLPTRTAGWQPTSSS